MVGLGLGASALAASSLLHNQNVLQYVPEHVLQSTRATAQLKSAATGNGELFTPAIDGFIRNTMKSWDMEGGLSIAIVRKRADGSGEFDVETRGYGAAARDGRPITEDTLLPIGSNSKAFTVAAVGNLVANESVNLDWTSKVHEVFPDFEFYDGVANKYASLVDIFSHRTGLPRHDLTFRDDGKKPLEDFSLRVLKHLPPSAEFREATQYNNHMFNIGASLISNLTGTRFQDFVQQHIFDAAGMSTATYELNASAAKGTLAEGFLRSGENTTYAGVNHATFPHPEEEKLVAGAGAIACSAKDVAIWLQVLLNDGKSPKTGKQVIPTAVLRKMETGVNFFSGPIAPELAPVVYGLALMSSSYQGHQYIEHGGALTGYLSQITRFPNSGLGIALLSNESPRGQYAWEAIRWRIAEELIGMPLRVDWNARYHYAHLAVLQIVEDEAKGRLPRPHDAPPPTAPLAELVGTYTNPAYGDLQAVLFQTKDNTLIRVAFNGSVFLQYLDLTHYSGNTFNATLGTFTPVLDTPSGELVEEAAGILAEFDVDEDTKHVLGFGISGGGQIWGAGTGVPIPTGKTPRERAEAWFERVESGEAARDESTDTKDDSQAFLEE